MINNFKNILKPKLTKPIIKKIIEKDIKYFINTVKVKKKNYPKFYLTLLKLGKSKKKELPKILLKY